MVNPITPEFLTSSTPETRLSLVWRFDSPRIALGSAPVGGGWGRIGWILNVGVSRHYTRTDLDRHASQMAEEAGLDGPGTSLFTAADVGRLRRAEEDGVVVDATVGVGKPTWAADVNDSYTPWRPGTINIVAQMPVSITPAAAVNAVITITEAKTQALSQARVPGTGTASDAVVVCWPDDEISTERFAGPRSPWGARLARTVHEVVLAGIGAGVGR